MGWCSGTDLFDEAIYCILNKDNLDKKELVKKLIEAFQDKDWDCEGDSGYYDHPIVNAAFKEMFPEWFMEDAQDE